MNHISSFSKVSYDGYHCVRFFRLGSLRAQFYTFVLHTPKGISLSTHDAYFGTSCCIEMGNGTPDTAVLGVGRC